MLLPRRLLVVGSLIAFALVTACGPSSPVQSPVGFRSSEPRPNQADDRSGARGVPSSELRLRPGNDVIGKIVNRETGACLLVLGVDCPISNGYAPEITSIIAEYEPRGIRFHAVYIDPDVDQATAEKHAADYGLKLPVTADRAPWPLASALDATHMPAAFVFGPTGPAVYRGRIDDRYPRVGKRREQPTTRDLRDALDALLSGQQIKTPHTDPVGCPLPIPGWKRD